MTNGSVSRKSWWTVSDEFIRKGTALGAKSSVPVNNDKYANKETQTENVVCCYCSFSLIKGMTPEKSRQITESTGSH